MADTDRLALLEGENESLRLRVTWLEGELGIARQADSVGIVARTFGLTPGEAHVALTLARACPRQIQTWAMDEGLPRSWRQGNVVKVYIARIRAKLGKSSIITSTHAYRMDATWAAKVCGVAAALGRAA